jgi:hypothetical protein
MSSQGNYKLKFQNIIQKILTKKTFFQFFWRDQITFLNPFLHFFQTKSSCLTKKIVRINIFKGELKNSAKISQKKESQAHFAKKNGYKKGTVNFYIFSKK